MTTERTSRITAYRNEALLSRYKAEFHASDDEASRCFETLKQFLSACSAAGGGRVPSKAVDRMWHTFLLFTRDYETFCKQELGTFLHHTPLTPDQESHAPDVRPVAVRLFGRVDTELWPERPDSADCESSSCDCCA